MTLPHRLRLLLCQITPESVYAENRITSRLARRSTLYALHDWLVRDPRLAGRLDAFVEDYVWTADDEVEGDVQAALAHNPHVVGISVYIWNARAAFDFARRLKLACPKVRIILGGSEVAEAGEILARVPYADAVVRGEGEVTLAETLVRLLDAGGDFTGVAGLSCRNATGAIIHNPERAPIADIGTLPDIYTPERLDGLDGTLFYQTSRGCYARCTFCAWSQTKYREARLDIVRAQLSAILAQPGLRALHLTDQSLNTNLNRAKALARLVDETNVHRVIVRGFLWLHLCDRELFELMVSANMRRLIAGIQSANEATLASIMHPGRHRTWAPKVREVTGEGAVSVDLIYGLPGESLATFKEGLRYCLAHGLSSLSAYRVRVLPGTKLWYTAEAEGIHFDREAPHYAFSTPGFSYADFDTAGRLARMLAQLTGLFSPHQVQWLTAQGVDFVAMAETLCAAGAPAAYPQHHGITPQNRERLITMHNLPDTGARAAWLAAAKDYASPKISEVVQAMWEAADAAVAALRYIDAAVAERWRPVFRRTARPGAALWIPGFARIETPHALTRILRDPHVSLDDVHGHPETVYALYCPIRENFSLWHPPDDAGPDAVPQALEALASGAALTAIETWPPGERAVAFALLDAGLLHERPAALGALHAAGDQDAAAAVWAAMARRLEGLSYKRLAGGGSACFEATLDGVTARFALEPREESRPCMVRSRHYNLVYLSGGTAPTAAVQKVLNRVSQAFVEADRLAEPQLDAAQ